MPEKTRIPLPRVEPLVPTTRPLPFNDPAWLFEPKYDGFRRGTLAYAAFDLLWINGKDLRGLPLSRRKKRLEPLIPASVGPLNRIPCFEEEGREVFEAACSLDLEGIVAKRKADPYAPQTAWCKIKNPAYTQAEGRGEFFERWPSKRGEIKAGRWHHLGLIQRLGIGSSIG